METFNTELYVPWDNIQGIGWDYITHTHLQCNITVHQVQVIKLPIQGDCQEKITFQLKAEVDKLVYTVRLFFSQDWSDVFHY